MKEEFVLVVQVWGWHRGFDHRVLLREVRYRPVSQGRGCSGSQGSS
jgi:hypothetical protein